MKILMSLILLTAGIRFPDFTGDKLNMTLTKLKYFKVNVLHTTYNAKNYDTATHALQACDLDL